MYALDDEWDSNVAGVAGDRTRKFDDAFENAFRCSINPSSKSIRQSGLKYAMILAATCNQSVLENEAFLGRVGETGSL